MRLYSIGHSTRSFEDFAALLAEHDIRILADIRTVPKSKHVPHFGGEILKSKLNALDPPIRYVHFPGLGGLRKPRRDSINAGWKNGSFRGYADYMKTSEFDDALEHLLELGQSDLLAFMCAEAVPWRCHRMLLSDAIKVRGHEVWHIIGQRRHQRHELTAFAVISGTRVSYPSAEPAQEGLL